jgi:hypothetical protein
LGMGVGVGVGGLNTGRDVGGTKLLGLQQSNNRSPWNPVVVLARVRVEKWTF